MTEKQINAALEELRKEIEKLEVGDQTAKEHLASLVENIENRLESPESGEEDHDLVEEMKDAVTQFEVEHPRITGIINDIMMTLSNVGI